MNLQSQITEVRRRIAEPYSVDPSDQNITDDEIVDWINQAELKMHYDIADEALGIAATGVITTASITSGTDSVALPSSPLMLRPVSVSLANATGLSFKPCRIIKYDDYLRHKSDPNWRTNHSNPMAAFMLNKIYLAPAKASGATVNLTYVVHPQRRYRHFRGSVTSRTSNTVWADTKSVTQGWPDDYFITSGFLTCDLKYTSGEPNGRTVNMSDYAGATGTFTVANTIWPMSNENNTPDVNVGDSYEVGQVSPLPEIFDLALYCYVEYLCHQKGNDEKSASSFQMYQSEIQRINSAYSFAMQGGRS